MRGVYVPRVNHLSVTSRPLAPTDITAIDCDLLPNVLQMQFFGHRRLLALQVTISINVVSRPLVFTDTTRLSCQDKKLVYIS